MCNTAPNNFLSELTPPLMVGHAIACTRSFPCITEDQWGRIYIGTGIGIGLDPETGRIKRFTMADGLPNAFVNVAYRDRNNVLWFGTLQGLSKFVPTIEPASEAPAILIQQLRVAGSDLPISELA